MCSCTRFGVVVGFWALLASAGMVAGCGDDDGSSEHCGDGQLVGPEECDDGNTVDGDGCSTDCLVEHGYQCWDAPSICRTSCGDGLLAGDEECDDGNQLNVDGCTAQCTIEFGYACSGTPSLCDPICGDEHVVGNEACDDGNVISQDGCSETCTVENGYECTGMPSTCIGICGNGWMTPDEACDDDNTSDADGCSALCEVEAGWECTGEPSSCSTICGDGIVTGLEPCDDAGESATCDDDCTPAVCGDGNLNLTAGEACDEAGQTASCDADCTLPTCGDSDVNVDAGEDCDDGGVVAGDGCDTSCLVEYGYACTGEPSLCQVDCGDGIVYGLEECDDAGETAACDANCTLVSCGDGDLNVTAGEECDDGNNTSGDGCDAACVQEFVCGDLLCDWTNGETCQACPADCCPDCGDGVRQAYDGEECDGADLSGQTCLDYCYSGGSLTCTSNCALDTSGCTGTLPPCGNNVIECGEQCDGNQLGGATCSSLGHDGGTLACGVGCQFDVSSCGALLCLPPSEAIRLQEATHMDPDYIAIINNSTCPVDVLGLHIATDDGTVDYFALPSQVLQPGEIVYLVESSGGTGSDINLGYNIAWVTNDDGYVLLCNGSCTNSANVVDALLFGSTPPVLPAPVTFQPAAMPDITTNQAYLRLAFTGVAPNFLVADWTTGTNTH